jgi:L-lactate dehydrogenase complex protein LldG
MFEKENSFGKELPKGLNFFKASSQRERKRERAKRMAKPVLGTDSLGNQSLLLEEFIRRFEILSGKAHRCFTTAEAIAQIDSLIRERSHQGSRCYYTREALRFLQEDKRGDNPDGILLAELYEPVDGSDGLVLLREADIGITTADYAIAETGCLVEIAYSESMKLLSSLPRVNIILLRAKTVLRNLQELAPILRNLLSNESTKNMKPVITLISGPSRTSDIEMKFVLGVHGPHEVHAIIVGE